MTKTKRQLDSEAMAQAMPQVLDALVGSTACNADTTLDDISLDNIPKLQAVAEWLHDRLYWASRSIDSPYYSAKRVAEGVIGACDGLDDFYLDNMHTYIECPHCHAQYSVRMWGDEKPTRCVAYGKELSNDQD